MPKNKVIVVGGGLAGLMATIKAAEAGTYVDLFSLVPVKRSHSVCAQGGINGAVNTKGEGDSPWQHFDDTVYGGDFLANQPPVKAMCDAAPGIIHLMDRMGVMFSRTPEGLLDFRRFGGTQYHRTAFAGATTGNNCCMRLMSRCVAGKLRDSLRSMSIGNFLAQSLMMTAYAAVFPHKTYARWKCNVQCRCGHSSNRRSWNYFRKNNELGY